MLKLVVVLSVIALAYARTEVLFQPNTPKATPGPNARPIVNPDTKVIGGSNADISEFPFQASLRFVSSNGHTCGGSIITSRHVMTAAHCVGNGNLYVVVGTSYLNSGGTRYEVARVIRHENYDPNNNWRNDIALLELTSSISFSNTVAQASLPASDTPGGRSVKISGWGATVSGAPSLPNTLQKLSSFPTVGTPQCESSTGISIYDGQICAGGVAGRGICQGDSGGPLSDNGSVIGIVSFVFMPCGSGYPDVFTRVYYYKDWIRSNTGSFSSELRFV